MAHTDYTIKFVPGVSPQKQTFHSSDTKFYASGVKVRYGSGKVRFYPWGHIEYIESEDW